MLCTHNPDSIHNSFWETACHWTHPSEMKFMTWWIFMNNSWIFMNYSWTAIIFGSWTKVHGLFMNNWWIIHEYAGNQKYSWNIHEPKFMNQVSWIWVTPVHERFVNNSWINIIHEIFMNNSWLLNTLLSHHILEPKCSWTLHELFMNKQYS